MLPFGTAVDDKMSASKDDSVLDNKVSVRCYLTVGMSLTHSCDAMYVCLSCQVSSKQNISSV